MLYAGPKEDLEETTTTFAEVFSIDARSLEFLNNQKFLTLVEKRAQGKEDEMKSLFFASMLNYVENPMASFEDDHLFFGSEVNAMDSETLKRFGISHILNSAGTYSGEFLTTDSDFTYKSITTEDVPEAQLPIEEAVAFIEESLQSGKKVLVHCIEGKSRSGSLIIAYLIKKYGWSFEEALRYVNQRRVAIPNEGFKQQLIAYATKVNTKAFTLSDFSSKYSEATQALIQTLQDRPNLGKALDVCAQQTSYIDAMLQLELSVTKAASTLKSVQSIGAKVNTRLLTLIKAVVHQQAISTSTFSESDELLLLHKELEEIYAACSAATNLPGCVEAKDMEQAFLDGNIREQHLIMRLALNTFVTEKVLVNGHAKICSSPSKDPIISGLCSRVTAYGTKGLLQKGKRSSSGEFFRVANGAPVKGVIAGDSRTLVASDVSTALIPLSDREQNFLESHPFSSWQSGTDSFLPFGLDLTVVETSKFGQRRRELLEQVDPNSLYYSTGRKFGHRVIVSMSGTLADVLNLGSIMGFSSIQDQRDLALSTIVNLVAHNHHSMYEILTSLRDYDPTIPFHADYYKILFPNSSFIESVESIYHDSTGGKDLPDKIFQLCVTQYLS